ncbi:YgiT-type zinc finger protein [candidate division KSB1 bacterium]|nr:YgiT-type zinc finger protein [candidate division KSB1 bacterium]
MIKITTCPTCGSKKIKKVRKNLTRSFQGQIYTVPNLEFHECPDCGERLYDRDAMRKIEAYSPAYAKARKRKKAA